MLACAVVSVVSVTGAVIRPSAPVKVIRVTLLRLRPLTWALPSTVAFRRPTQSFRQTTSLIDGVPGAVAPPALSRSFPSSPAAEVALAAEATPARARRIKAASTAVNLVAGRRPGRGLLANCSLFRWPAELAVGLALKELRYGRVRPIRPRDLQRSLRFLRSRPASGRDSALLARQYNHAYGRGRMAGAPAPTASRRHYAYRPPRRGCLGVPPRLFDAKDEDLRRHTQPTASETGTSSTPRARRSGGWRPGSPTPCAASASPNTRPTSTPATS